MSVIPPTWRSLDAATREREYSPSSCIGGDYQPYVQAYAERSREARSNNPVRRDLRYGVHAAQRLDLFVPPHPPVSATSGPPPLLVFIHGGFWQELSKEDSAFPAADCMRQSIAFAAVDYTLAPRATLAQMVVECREALSWLRGNAASLGFDAERIVVAGSSAGAHLAAMAALPGATGSAQTGIGCARAAVLVSGIYELEPLVGTSINSAVGLTPESAREFSPAMRPLEGFPRCIVCWGAVETTEFKRQSLDFAARLERAGTSCQVFEVPRRNHFDVILELADPGTMLGRAVIALMRSA